MRIEDGLLRYKVIIDDLADLRKHAGELPPEYRDTDYNEIVRVMCDWCEHQFGKKKVKWNYWLDSAYDPPEDNFSFQEEHHRTLFILRWS